MLHAPSFQVLTHRYGSDSVAHREVTVLVRIAEFRDLQSDHMVLKGFTDQELSLCRAQRTGAHSMSARYAAKRAAEILTGEPWERFEVVRERDQAPWLRKRDDLSSLNSDEGVASEPDRKYRFLLSLTHDEPLAAAYLVLLDKEEDI